MTAPIYNAELLNKKMLDEQEKMKSNLQKEQLRPPLMHSQSVCNVNLSTQRIHSSPEMANNSTLAFSTPMTNRLGPVQNHPPSDSNFTPYQIAQNCLLLEHNWNCICNCRLTCKNSSSICNCTLKVFFISNSKE